MVRLIVMKTSWEAIGEHVMNYIQVSHNEVIVGHHSGSGFSDTAGSCSHQEFFNGQYHDLILEKFNPEVLEEVKHAAKNASQHFAKRIEDIKRRKEFLDEIPTDESLKILDKHPDTFDGFSNYGNKGNFKTLVKSDTSILFFDKTTGYIKTQGKRIPIEFPYHASSVVELHDYFYVIIGGFLMVISPEGKIVYNLEDENFDNHSRDPVFGEYIRLNHVFRHSDVIFFKYRWFFSDYKPGLIRYELNKGLIGHWEVED